MPVVDYLIVTPLDEEFRAFREAWPVDLVEVRVGRIHYYKALHTRPTGRQALVVATSMGAMGQAWSGVFASEALRLWAPANVIQIGIAGSLVGDKRPLGDVIIPDQVIGYEIGEAIEEPGLAPYRFRPTGSQGDFALIASARALCNEPKAYAAWQALAADASRRDFATAGLPERTPTAHIGTKEVLASGNFVVKSPDFAGMLLAINGDIRAVEMEAKGLFDALRLASEHAAALVIRGISDYAGTDKEAVDARTNGAYRRACVRSAAIFLSSLIERRMDYTNNNDLIAPPLHLTPKQSRRGTAAARSYGLNHKGSGTTSFVLDPLMERPSGAPELVVTAKILGDTGSAMEASMALRQVRGGWARIVPPTATSSSCSWTIERDPAPYTLSIAVVAKPLIDGIRITVADEFGRSAQFVKTVHPPLPQG